MDEVYTVREVADKLKVSVSTIYRYVENGDFPHQRIGTNIRFSDRDIEAFLSGCPKTSTQNLKARRSYYGMWN
jgi:excisionase family DNA binding protein